MFSLWDGKQDAPGSIATSTQVKLLENLAAALEREIVRQLDHFREPVWTNPVTGQKMTSLYALTKAPGIDTARTYRPRWCEHIRLRQHVLDDVSFRGDLPKKRKSVFWSNSTPCIDISSFQLFLYEKHPVLAHRVFTAFKRKHGLI